MPRAFTTIPDFSVPLSSLRSVLCSLAALPVMAGALDTKPKMDARNLGETLMIAAICAFSRFATARDADLDTLPGDPAWEAREAALIDMNAAVDAVAEVRPQTLGGLKALAVALSLRAEAIGSDPLDDPNDLIALLDAVLTLTGGWSELPAAWMGFGAATVDRQPVANCTGLTVNLTINAQAS